MFIINITMDFKELRANGDIGPISLEIMSDPVMIDSG